MTNVSARRLLFVAFATILACSAASRAAAMTYSTAAYLGTDGWTVSGWGELDDLTGCNSQLQNSHTGLWSPGGRYGDGWLPFEDEMGTWYTSITFEVWCNCGSHVMPFYAGTSGEAAINTIDVKYKPTGELPNPGQQIKHCYYAKCPISSDKCGTGFEDVVGLEDDCPEGIWSTWRLKTFLGMQWGCEEIDHIHMEWNPCP